MNKVRKYVKLIALVALLIAVVFLFPQINNIYNDVERIIESSGNVAPFVYIILMILAILISPIPSSPLAIIGGIFFGPFLGMLYTLIGATIGAVLAFLIARFFLGDYISKRLERNKFYQKIKGKKERNIAKIILITRLMPHVSFDIVSYAAGLTSLNVLTFALITFIGMMPIVFLLSFFGFLIQPYLSIILILVGISFVSYILYLALKKS
ncbi:hypothetical protein COU62_02030 [Candidatus Pacearchaeota archaeon CG10_big_fil_rev_8_21_14_0_10_35_219]|nr:TVP38/TMEM64 family protein [Candidatus Pacearchaeota archaeon]PIO07971.1 MAG: hypothetical protein COU62_02030 [Candidatus Pacearchaeota archaeon CG10_big_fil_rev_8_21_14_0_10_35_219]PIY81425.1 MAG: hypothetical protein COY79_02835 [Candidatus Pacearchaeota archaeon CG_4_10_14_0_8_um_filter_35_169]PIZ80611.1 MAG: hypothetical protein COY00_00610 [Candidatus Pacearchaeota archaeon CG_4_10_14_0_2_um_filter_35_33]PJA70108.1 MAG: hypothetical protein CO155_01575 [Candidatus Pacearchaeota archae